MAIMLWMDEPQQDDLLPETMRPEPLSDPVPDNLAEALLARALRLRADERAELAHLLSQSIEQFEFGDEQRAELRVAMDEIDSGAYVDGETFLREFSDSSRSSEP